MTTLQKIKFLQAYMNKWSEKWQKLHPENVVGFRIDKKVAKSERSKNYSIIFHVAKKLQEKDITKKSIIPKFFKIKFPDGVERKIMTDVEETKQFEFHLHIGSNVYSNFSGTNYGSAGLFLTQNGRTFVLTNYHVAAWSMMNNNVFYYRRPAQQLQNNITLTDNFGRTFGRFETGIMSQEIDVAFIELHVSPGPLNALPQGRYVNGFVRGPLSPAINGSSVTVYKPAVGGVNSTIVTNSSTFPSGYQNINFRDIILINRVTNPGDSGSLVVMTNTNAILGIVMGAFDRYTCVVPFYKINNFYPLTIL